MECTCACMCTYMCICVQIPDPSSLYLYLLFAPERSVCVYGVGDRDKLPGLQDEGRGLGKSYLAWKAVHGSLPHPIPTVCQDNQRIL